MLKMFRGRDRRSQGGVSHNDVQIFKHLEEADVDTLIDELAVLTDDAADGNVRFLYKGIIINHNKNRANLH